MQGLLNPPKPKTNPAPLRQGYPTWVQSLLNPKKTENQSSFPRPGQCSATRSCTTSSALRNAETRQLHHHHDDNQAGRSCPRRKDANFLTIMMTRQAPFLALFCHKISLNGWHKRSMFWHTIQPEPNDKDKDKRSTFPQQSSTGDDSSFDGSGDGAGGVPLSKGRNNQERATTLHYHHFTTLYITMLHFHHFT